jgi:hypothetical protein
MNGTDGHYHGNVANLEVSDAMLGSDGLDIVQLGSLGGTPFQHVRGTGVLGVIEGSDIGTMVVVTHDPDEQGNATNGGSRHQRDRPADVDRRLADAGEEHPRASGIWWHA